MKTFICTLCDASITDMGDFDHLIEQFKKKHEHKSVSDALEASAKEKEDSNPR